MKISKSKKINHKNINKKLEKLKLEKLKDLINNIKRVDFKTRSTFRKFTKFTIA